jgi:hypothetical protein
LLAAGVPQLSVQSKKPFRRAVGRDGYNDFRHLIETHERKGDFKEPSSRTTGYAVWESHHHS